MLVQHKNGDRKDRFWALQKKNNSEDPKIIPTMYWSTVFPQFPLVKTLKSLSAETKLKAILVIK